MPYELFETPDALHVVGTCFVDELALSKPLVVDGDLVAQRLRAPQITVTHGSLLCPELESDDISAEILGIFLENGKLHGNWRYTWLRPVLTLPDEARWGSEDAIRNVIPLFLHAALVRDIHPAERLLLRASQRPTCGRARVLFHTALEELRDTDALTPLGVLVANAFLAHPDLPKDWRW